LQGLCETLKVYQLELESNVSNGTFPPLIYVEFEFSRLMMAAYSSITIVVLTMLQVAQASSTTDGNVPNLEKCTSPQIHNLLILEPVINNHNLDVFLLHTLVEFYSAVDDPIGFGSRTFPVTISSPLLKGVGAVT